MFLYNTNMIRIQNYVYRAPQLTNGRLPFQQNIYECFPMSHMRPTWGSTSTLRYPSGLNINTANGGKFNTNDNACPWLCVSSATAPPLLP